MKRFAILCLCILILSGIACRRASISKDRPVYIDVEVVYRGTQCSGPEKGPSAEWVLDAGHLSFIYSRLNRHIISPKVSRPPEVDFSSSVLLLVDMGRVPSAGYAIDLADSAVPVVRETAGISILWVEPAPGSVRAQVIGSPCLILKLPKTGYTSASLTDQNEKVFLKLLLPVK